MFALSDFRTIVLKPAYSAKKRNRVMCSRSNEL